MLLIRLAPKILPPLPKIPLLYMFSISCILAMVASKAIANSLRSSVPKSSKKSILTYLCPRLPWRYWRRATSLTHVALCVKFLWFGGCWTGCTSAQCSAGRDKIGSDGVWWRRRSGRSPPGNSAPMGAPWRWWPPSNTWGGWSQRWTMTGRRCSGVFLVQGRCGRGWQESSSGRG